MRRVIRLLAVFHVVEGGLEYVAALLIGTGLGWGSARSDEVSRSSVMAMLLLLALGTSRIAAGWLCWRLRGRVFGLVSLVLGLAASFTFCPTPLALLAFGLVVYLHPDVRAAFEMRSLGATPEEAIAGADIESAELAAIFDDDPPTDDPRGLCDDDLARAIIERLPGDWKAATLTVSAPEDEAGDEFAVEIRGPAGASVEPGRAVVRALRALDALLRQDRQQLIGLRMRLWREDTWRFAWIDDA